MTVHSLRLIASFALLGAVLAGSLTGWMEHNTIDFRMVGAALGALAAIGGKAMHVL